jgi:hypothetical protein
MTYLVRLPPTKTLCFWSDIKRLFSKDFKPECGYVEKLAWSMMLPFLNDFASLICDITLAGLDDR